LYRSGCFSIPTALSSCIVVLLGFFWLARISHAFAAGWLALASLFFYGYWNPAYVGLLLGSISCNYAFGLWIAKAGVRQGWASASAWPPAPGCGYCMRRHAQAIGVSARL
jgi:D-alanyl-lipoteichoic acid acyltransferase DltB (MBOAT superfamily)